MTYDVIVIGAGAVGLAVARELAADGTVLVLERGLPGRAASWAAAGMLCPHGEAERDDPLFRLGLASLKIYRAFAESLGEETGVDVEYEDAGTLVLASGEREWAGLCSRGQWQRAAGLEAATLVEPSRAVKDEPALTLDLSGALWCPGDHQIRPRALLDALRKSCKLRGAQISSGAPVEEICRSGDRVTGARASGVDYHARSVVVASGAWSNRIRGLAPRVGMRPRKGQILALGMPAGLLERVIRWRQYYLVPRRNGELVVGATNEDCGFDRSITADGVSSLLEAAARISVRTRELRLLEIWSGLRPEAPDGLPVIGQADLEGLFYAFGHYRNGILHTPETARIIGELVRGGPPGVDPAFSPLRFAGNPSIATHV